MNSDNKSKGIHIKIRICSYSDYIININDLNLDILLVEKSYENILVYNVAYKYQYEAKPVSIVFNNWMYQKLWWKEIFSFIKNDSDEKCEIIFEIVRYIIMLKSNISHIFSHKYAIFEISSDDELSLEKRLNMK